MNLLYDVPTTAAMLCMSRARLYEVMRDGGINAVKHGKRTLFHRDEIERFAANLQSVA